MPEKMRVNIEEGKCNNNMYRVITYFSACNSGKSVKKVVVYQCVSK